MEYVMNLPRMNDEQSQIECYGFSKLIIVLLK